MIWHGHLCQLCFEMTNLPSLFENWTVAETYTRWTQYGIGFHKVTCEVWLDVNIMQIYIENKLPVSFSVLSSSRFTSASSGGSPKNLTRATSSFVSASTDFTQIHAGLLCWGLKAQQLNKANCADRPFSKSDGRRSRGNGRCGRRSYGNSSRCASLLGLWVFSKPYEASIEFGSKGSIWRPESLANHWPRDGSCDGLCGASRPDKPYKTCSVDFALP